MVARDCILAESTCSTKKKKSGDTECDTISIYFILLDFSLTVKAAPNESEIRTSQP